MILDSFESFFLLNNLNCFKKTNMQIVFIKERRGSKYCILSIKTAFLSIVLSRSFSSG